MPPLITPIWMLMGGARGKLGPSTKYLLRDDFKDTRAAGAVNGTAATPTGGARTVVDTNSKISVGSGVLNAAVGMAANDGLVYGGVTRTAGLAYISKYTGNGQAGLEASFNTSLAPGFNTGIVLFSTSTILVRGGGASAPSTVGTFVDDTPYYLATVLRASGAHYFIKGGAFTNWTLLWNIKAGTNTPLYPSIRSGGNTVRGAYDFFRIPVATITITPLASDAFTRSDGVLGNTGGGGSEESGGSGLAWTAQAGTWGVATNKAACSALTGAAFATVNSGSANVMIEAVVTRSGGNAGLVARYAGANDYIVAYHDGTNMHLDKVTTAGGTTSLINTATTYSATARTILSLNGTGVRLYYNNEIVGTQQTVSDATLQSGTAHGLYTSDTGATFDNFVVWAKGNGGEYEASFNKYILP